MLPAGLADLLPSSLLPRLRLADLQSLRQTCTELKQLVLAAQPEAWQGAAARDGLPGASLSAGDLYHKAAHMATNYTAVKAGPSGQASLPSNGYEAGFEPVALHPSFNAAVHSDVEACSLVVKALAAGTSAALVRPEHLPNNRFESPGAHCQAEQSCAPDGSHFLADLIQESESERTTDCSARLYNTSSGQHCELEVPFYSWESVSWAPNSSSFALLGTGCAVYEGRLSQTEPQRSSWLLPDMDFFCCECGWTPCSTHIAVMGEEHLVVASIKDQTILTRLSLDDIVWGAAWMISHGQPVMALWLPRRPRPALTPGL